MSTMRQPVIYMSHGGGPGFFMDGRGSLFEDIDKNSPGKKFFENLAKLLPQLPRAIVIVSAHWEENDFTVQYQPEGTSLIYDYYGFPEETYAPYFTYDAPTDIELADKIVELLKDNHLDCKKMDRGFDHGVFCPMKLAFPEGNIPIVQVSLKANLDPSAHVALGKALSPLRDENILLLGSGSLTHSLREMGGSYSNSKPAKWATEFTTWTNQVLEGLSNSNVNQVEEDIVNIMNRAPSAQRSHPRTEHLVPLFFSFGAGVGNYDSQDKNNQKSIKCSRVFSYMAMGTLSLDTYLFQ